MSFYDSRDFAPSSPYRAPSTRASRSPGSSQIDRIYPIIQSNQEPSTRASRSPTSSQIDRIYPTIQSNQEPSTRVSRSPTSSQIDRIYPTLQPNRANSTHVSRSPTSSQIDRIYPTIQSNHTTSYSQYGLSKLTAAQEFASHKRVLLRTCLVGGIIVLAMIGMALVLMTYICVINQCSRSGLSLTSTASLGKVLTISQVVSHLAPITVPIIMGLNSYLLSAKWLQSSEKSRRNRPTPMQLGLLLSICSGAGIPALFASFRYTFGAGRAAQKNRPSTPPMLRRSIFLLASLLALAYLGTGADAWLHVSSRPVTIMQTSPYDTTQLKNFSRDLNTTMCDPSLYTPGSVAQQTCGISSGGSIGIGRHRMESIRALANASALHRVEFAEDQTALLVPQSLPANITFTAKTRGIRSRCKSITRQCLNSTKMPDGSLWYGPMADLSLDCKAGGIPYNSTSRSQVSPLDSQGNSTDWSTVPTNPFMTGEVVASQAYYDDSNTIFDNFLPNTGWFIHGNNGAYNVVYCNISVLDVEYTYSASQYRIRSSSLSSPASIRQILPSSLEMTDATISDAVEGAGLQTSISYEEAYSLELSRQALARGAVMYLTKDALSIEKEIQIIGTTLQIIPLAIFLAATFLFMCVALITTAQIVVSSWGIPYVHLAALQMNDPVAAVQALYSHPEPLLTWEDRTTKKFGDESDKDRLFVGPTASPQGGFVFAVIKDNSRAGILT